jgi:hypothetical protein
LADYFNFGLNQITAVYTGDGTYQESVSLPINLTVVENGATPDFTVASSVPEVAVPQAGSADVSINLGSLYGFDGTVNLSCTTASTAVGCSIAPTSVTVKGAATVTLTISAAATKASLGTHPPLPQGWLWLLSGGTNMFGSFLLAGFSRPNRRLRLIATATLFVMVLFWVGCGGGGQAMPPPPPPQPTPPPTVNAYNVIVTGTANGIVHNTTVIAFRQ